MFELAGLGDDEVISVVRFWERVAGLAAAAQLAAIAELARRRPRSLPDAGPAGHSDAGDPLVPEVSEFAVHEVAAALRLSRSAAGARLHVAVELTRLPAAAAALAAGTLDLPKVRALVDTVAVLDHGSAVAVTGRVLPRAGTQTVGQLRASLSRAALAVDPGSARRRHAAAVASRQVVLRPARDGMAELCALLPADAAVAVHQRVDELARRQEPGGREMDARRADALVAAVLGGSAPAVASLHVTVPARTALGLGSQPGELAGYGPVPAGMARRLAAGVRWRNVTTDPATGAVREIGRRAYPADAARADLEPALGAGSGLGRAGGEGVGPDVAGGVIQDGRAPAGDVTAGGGGYVPSVALAELVRVRDRTCRFPGCRHPARRCDLDHVVAWPDGPTTADNLAALCRHHHRLKHQTAWAVRAGPGAVLEWTSPAGQHYTTVPAF